MLGLTEYGGLCACQHQREPCGQLRSCRACQRLPKIWQRVVAVLDEGFRPELDLARWRREPAGIALGVDDGMLAVLRGECDPDAAWFCLQLFQGHAAGAELLAIGGMDIAVPEVLAQAEPLRQVKDEVDVGSRFARWRHDRLAPLHEGLCLSTDLISDLQGFTLEARGYRENNVCHCRRRCHEQVGMGVELQRRKRGPPARWIGLRKQ